jgi:hypothetical protein
LAAVLKTERRRAREAQAKPKEAVGTTNLAC